MTPTPDHDFTLVIPSYTTSVKTAISLPDQLYRQATSRAQELGISRSEFFADAARHYLGALDRASLTARIDAAVELAGEDQGAALVAAAGKRLLATSEW